MRWTAVFGAGLFGGLLLLHRLPTPYGFRGSPVTGARIRALRDSVDRLHGPIFQAEVREGLVRRAESETPVARGLYVVHVDTGGSMTTVDAEVALAFRQAWAAIPHRDTSLATIIVSEGHGRVILTFRSGRSPVCVAKGWANSTTPVGAAEKIGVCAFYSAFGSPSPAVDTWLNGSLIGIDAMSPWAADYASDWNSLLQDQERYDAGDWAIRLSRVLPFQYGRAALGVASCAAGRPRPCGALLVAAKGRPSVYAQDPDNLAGVAGFILADMERQFGDERFSRFWSSDRPVSEAFQSAFGVPADRWMHDEVRRYVGALEPGAGDVGRAGLSALAWALVFLGLTAFLARRLRA